ncbi:MAG: Beta-lactamase [Clostridia bacterium]|jgi:bla regulator protein BlaR1|nr:Beta-lactamase [Clostridia bacterium]
MRRRRIIPIAILGIILVILIYTGLKGNIDYRNNKNVQDVNIQQQSGEQPAIQEKEAEYIYEDLSTYFSGYDGCFVLYNPETNTYTIHNKEKSIMRLPPNSSFKIYNSLIGLESGVLKDENTLFQWDGTKHSIEVWNQDHTLASAFSNSVVWYYKQLASQVGEKTMQEYIDKIEYGNKDISGGIDRFWLQSSIKISPMEQIELLRKLYNFELPFKKENIDVVKKIMILSNKNGIVFRGKTGSGMKDGKYINGWFVGYVEKEDKVYLFATNIEAVQEADGKRAKEITIELLKSKDLL